MCTVKGVASISSRVGDQIFAHLYGQNKKIAEPGGGGLADPPADAPVHCLYFSLASYAECRTAAAECTVSVSFSSTRPKLKHAIHLKTSLTSRRSYLQTSFTSRRSSPQQFSRQQSHVLPLTCLILLNYLTVKMIVKATFKWKTMSSSIFCVVVLCAVVFCVVVP